MKFKTELYDEDVLSHDYQLSTNPRIRTELVDVQVVDVRMNSVFLLLFFFSSKGYTY